MSTPPNSTFKLCGLEVERKTDILALTAFLLSFAGIAAQAYFFFRGADTHLFAPEQVLIVGQDYPDGRRFLRLSAPMVYVNRGQSGYNDIVKRETVAFVLDGHPRELQWQEFVASSADGTKILMNKKSDALPLAIAGGATEAHETYFAPRTAKGPDPAANFIAWDAFLAALEKQGEIDFEFRFDRYDADRRTAKCRMKVDEALRLYLKQKGWSARPCAPIT
jgi:hypothetical protein